MLYVDPIAERHIAAAGASSGVNARRDGAAQEFERFFLYQMVREMRKSVPKTDLFGKSQQKEVYEEMFDDFMSGEMAKSNQLGIGNLVKQELQKTQDAQALAKSGARKAYADGMELHPFHSISLDETASASFALPSRTRTGIALTKPHPDGIPLVRRSGQ